MEQQHQEMVITSDIAASSGTQECGTASGLPSDINQADFQTLKAASDTLRVRIIKTELILTSLNSKTEKF